jgi:hypothetical protein
VNEVQKEIKCKAMQGADNQKKTPGFYIKKEVGGGK